MSLKDLTISLNQVTEELIEQIVSPFIRYDLENSQIFFLPESNILSARARILIFLTATKGWEFLDPEKNTAIAPREIENATGISGGTVRPLLGELVNDRLIVRTGTGAYEVSAVALPLILQQLRRSSKVDAPEDAPRGFGVEEHQDNSKGGQRKPTRPRSNISSSVSKLVDDGYFSKNKTIGDVLRTLHEKGITIAVTSLSGALLTLVRQERLVREKDASDGIYRYRSIS